MKINYAIINTNLHYQIVQAIQKNKKEPTLIIDARRKNDINGSRLKYFKSRLNVLHKMMRFVFDRDKCLLVSHPFNPWNSLFILISKEIEIYDDGVAYYNNTNLPKGIKSIIYMLLSRNLNASTYSPNNLGYLDYLKSSCAKVYYALFPDFFEEELQLPVKKIIFNGIHNSKGGNKVAFFDSPESSHHDANTNAYIITFLKNILSSDSSVEIYFKAHPHSTSDLCRVLRKLDWANEIKCSAEEFLYKEDVITILSFCSSIGFYWKAIDKDCNVLCFEQQKNKKLRKLAELTGIKTIEIQC